MSRTCKAIGVTEKGSLLGPLTISRRALSNDDVLIKVEYCGICHSDIHTIREEWGPIDLPCVVGHEAIGKVEEIGSHVTKYRVGDVVGVGCYVDSCRTCRQCSIHQEQHCKTGPVYSYQSKAKYPHCAEYTPEGGAVTQGGYSEYIVCQQDYMILIPEKLWSNLPGAAPLLCAGITTYSPIKRHGLNSTHRFAVVGLGGLGHMAVKFGKAFGAHTTVISRGEAKRDKAMELGADAYLNSNDISMMKAASQGFDLIINTVSAYHDVMAIIALLDYQGTMVMVGGVPEELKIKCSPFFAQQRRLEGSLIGGIEETQEMMHYCADHNITCEVEVVNTDKVNEAYDRTVKGDVHYRFVIDLKSL